MSTFQGYQQLTLPVEFFFTELEESTEYTVLNSHNDNKNIIFFIPDAENNLY